MKDLQKKYNTKETEEKWQKYWKDNKIFKFDWNDIERKNIFSIDTPPPHVSGSLHMGHIFGYSQMDTIARFWRMFGKNVFYPVGFDDNGLPSERYVEKKIGKKSKSMNRQEFVKICDKEIQDAEEFMKDQFIRMNYSYDFDLAYRTISPTARKVSQMSFIDLYNKGALYRKEEPIIWDVVDQTALAQTEAEDKEIESQMNFIEFSLAPITPPLRGSQTDEIGLVGGYKKLYSQKALDYAKELRNNTTDAEKLLWYYLKDKQMFDIKFRRQAPIGDYIVDFVSFEIKLVIELDGGQHNEDKSIKYDEKRTKFLEDNGFKVIRFWDNDIFKNMDRVLETIYDTIKTITPHQTNLEQNSNLFGSPSRGERLGLNGCIFSSNRLYFKNINSNLNEDIEMLVKMHNDGDIMKFVGFPNGLNTTFEKEKEQRVREVGTLEELIFCYDKQTDSCIGYCKIGEPGIYRQAVLDNKKFDSLKLNAIDKKVVCIDYKLKKEFWGKGYGTEVVSSLIDYIYNTLNLDVDIQTDPNILNIASIKICEKCGFEKTGIFETFKDTNNQEIKSEILRFKKNNFQSNKLTIMTTRPELLPACVAIFAHPDDKEKYKNKYVITPLGVKVPILFDESVEKDKGTGVMMCCTFGDNADVEKYKKYNLPLKIIINEKGCLYFDNVPEIDNKYKLRLDGLFTEKARVEILNILKEEGRIAKNPEKILHNVKIGERSKSPLEILVKSQWNIKTLDIKEELHKKASEINWYPKWMETRIHNWIDGLNWNWTISRQRFFGVPVPCWYSKKAGEEGKVILPEIEDLPVDPTIDLPKGYSADEIVPENDVFDTWMTSSISPQLSMWGISENMNCDKERFEILDIPFDLRTQGHDIIRTWAFCTLVKSYYHENKIPWKDIFVNGFCLAADGTKMSKSKGNGVDPLKVIDEFGADAVRYWALNSQLGTDTNYSVDMIKIGQKLITKLYNSAKFVEMNFKNLTDEIYTAKEDIENNLIFESMDKWLISKMKSTIEKTTQSFKKYDYSKALETAEKFFWDDFCDNYLEIVKVRCYGASGFKYENLELTEKEIEKINKSQQSAIRTIYYVFNAILKLFSPFMPSITEEIYSIIYENEFNDKKSISARGNWPNIKDFTENSELEIQGNIALDIIAEVRKYKSEKQISIKEKLECIYVNGNYGFDKGIIEDLKNVCNVKYILFNKDEINNNNYKSVKILVIDTEEKLQKLLNYAED